MHILKQRTMLLLVLLGLTLGSYRGYVALFEDDSEEPRQVFPFQVSALPPVDQAALDEGIPVRSEKELHHLLEDYLS